MLAVRAAWPDLDEKSLLSLINKGGGSTLTPAYATAFAKIARTRISGRDLSRSLPAWLQARRPKGSRRSCSSIDVLNYCGDLLSGKCPGVRYAKSFSSYFDLSLTLCCSQKVLLSLRQERKRATDTSKQRDIGVSDSSQGLSLRNIIPYIIHLPFCCSR